MSNGLRSNPNRRKNQPRFLREAVSATERSAAAGNGRVSQVSTKGFFQCPQTRADVPAPGQPWGGGLGGTTPNLRTPSVVRLAQGRGARATGATGSRPGDFPPPPPPPAFTCLAKNLPSSLRLFSFLAASKRSGAAATSRKRCSMSAGPAAPGGPQRSLRSARSTPEPRRSRAASASNYAPGESRSGSPADAGRTAAHVGEHAAPCVISPRPRPQRQGSPSPAPSAAETARVTPAPLPGGKLGPTALAVRVPRVP